jgi:hypothetical protein
MTSPRYLFHCSEASERGGEAFFTSPWGDVLLWNQILPIHALAAEPTV